MYELVAHYSHKAFCGTYSQDGNIFLSASQGANSECCFLLLFLYFAFPDRNIRVYDTSYGNFKLRKEIVARDVGWSVLDVAFSPDGHYLIYSSWSDSSKFAAR
jgi:WD repeat-containing protein 23